MEVNFNKPSIYSIKVQGELGEEWSGRLAGMQITIEQNKEGKPISIITGWLSDQSALSGIMNTLYELHLPVISVNVLDDNEK